MHEGQINLAVIGLFPESTSDRIQKLRLEIAEKFDVHDALNWPPHLTLRPGFHVPLQEAQNLSSEFKNFLLPFNPIKVMLSGFKFFDDAIVKGTVKRPYVATIDVVTSTELSEMNRKLIEFEPYSVKHARLYDPHVTLAYNDVDEEKFNEIKNYLADKVFHEECTIDTVALFENTGFGNERKMFAKIKLG